MRRQSVSLFLASAFLALSLMASGCSFKATFKETTDTTSNMTGTTSSARSWVSEDGHLKPEYQAIAFVTVNQTNLQHDMAKGGGEYLTSLGTLIGVPAHEHLAYGAAVQARYAQAQEASLGAPVTWLTLLGKTAQSYRTTATATSQNEP